MSSFLDLYPKIRYDISKSSVSNYQIITNITFRLNIVREVLNNISAYFAYDITDTDTPEILAEKVYGNPEAYWIILYANDIMDPQYDWPLNGRAFNNYIIDKYGSVANAKTQIHHYEKVVQREVDDIVTTFRYQVNETSLITGSPGVPYDSYNTLPATQSVTTYSVNGKSVTETISRNAVSNYDWEDQQNEAKRSIKIIKKDYYLQIVSEFNNLTGANSPSFLRRL